MKKTCETCRHKQHFPNEEPCYTCRLLSCWESKPKEQPKKQTVSRQELAGFIAKACDDIKGLFAYKNTDYGAAEDAFANFRKTAQRIVIPFMAKHGVTVSEAEAMFLVALIYQDKHLVALSHTGIDGHEVDERLGDIANYSLIMKGMREAMKGE